MMEELSVSRRGASPSQPGKMENVEESSAALQDGGAEAFPERVVCGHVIVFHQSLADFRGRKVIERSEIRFAMIKGGPDSVS